jgi:hypothetical protein
MIRLATLFWLVMVSATGFAMFAVKYEVQALDDQLVQTTRRAGNTEHEIRALDAEWAYLNRPDALARMNQRYLSLTPIATKQLRTSVTDIPLRPAPPPAVETVVASETAAGIGAVPTPQNAPVASQPTYRQQQRNPPAGAAAPVVTVALETRVASPEPARPAPVRAAARPGPPRRAKSLDELIAQITESR